MDGRVLSQEVRDFLENEVDPGQTFRNTDIHKHTQIYTIPDTTERQRQINNISLILKRLADDGIIRRHGKRMGEWRKISGDLIKMDFLKAEREVNVSAGQARDWFLSLKEHPERYRFSTHEGFEFVDGSFGQVGSRFKTGETFLFLRLELLFELTEIGGSWFRFRLIRPAWLDIWGAFFTRELSPESIVLRLEIGSSGRLGETVLGLPLVASAIREQITKEVVHIGASMEASIKFEA